MTQTQPSAYALAGVDIAAGTQATELMKEAVRATYGPEVLWGMGAFGGLFDVSALKGMEAPILVASTDGVGTKTKAATRLGRFDSIGQDLVNHCVNDILVQGAKPLFFLDYVAASKLDPQQIATVVGGVAKACRENGCALLGGETAEMPGVYVAGELDLAGTIVGVVDKPHLIDGSTIAIGNKILALPSSGAHTNGYSLLRRVLEPLDWAEYHQELGSTLGEAILQPHRSYLADIQTLLREAIPIRGLAHITGGGIVDNLPRIFREGIGAIIWRGSWPELPLFGLIQRLGQISDEEMFHVFNMGVGMLIVVSAEHVAPIQALLPSAALIGEIVAGDGVKIIF